MFLDGDEKKREKMKEEANHRMLIKFLKETNMRIESENNTEFTTAIAANSIETITLLIPTSSSSFDVIAITILFDATSTSISNTTLTIIAS